MSYLPELHYCCRCGDYLGIDNGDGICLACESEETMATRYGTAVLHLLKDRGWKEAPVSEEFICGDQNVLHPETNEEITVYNAAKIQKEKSGEYPDFLPKGY